MDDASSLTPAAHIMMLILFVSVLRLLTHLRYSTWVAKELKGRKSGSRQQKQEVFDQQRDRVKEVGNARFCSVPCPDSQKLLAPCNSPVVSDWFASYFDYDRQHFVCQNTGMLLLDALSQVKCLEVQRQIEICSEARSQQASYHQHQSELHRLACFPIASSPPTAPWVTRLGGSVCQCMYLIYKISHELSRHGDTQ